MLADDEPCSGSTRPPPRCGIVVEREIDDWQAERECAQARAVCSIAGEHDGRIEDNDIRFLSDDLCYRSRIVAGFADHHDVRFQFEPKAQDSACFRLVDDEKNADHGAHAS